MGEVSTVRESKASPLNGAKGGVPSGKRLNYDDDVVTIYNAEGRVVEEGIWDESVYNREPLAWDEKAKNYKLRYGYRAVVK